MAESESREAKVRLVICPYCGDHAWIAFPNEAETRTFLSKATGERIIQILFDRGCISPKERSRLRLELGHSGLVEDDHYIGRLLYLSEVFETLPFYKVPVGEANPRAPIRQSLLN